MQQEPPAGRYGRSADAVADRRLKIVGAVLGTGLLGIIGWFGVSYISGTDVSGELIKFKVVSDEAVEAHVEVRKDQDADGVCTLRAMEENGREVGRKAVRIDGAESRVDTVVTVRTTARAVTAELVSCEGAES
ncbi:DUF4307 domain-containing protein [Streptomyces sp. N2-109]|uniref:DUF4307 domain-containing protein n=1 Tax=Streptomyces gossypii TaxID=2883101 RepID=A0ABT2K538_9ACTN|nr:DUF4307 domain-containing protein [Streptomyces gossypii]MCT2594609.1 DUF4307 domain-containing protein [Streptomyces gossypii]